MKIMSPSEAWLYAAQWGSFMHAGDPGACMYGFSEDCRPQSEQHRQSCLNWIDTECIPAVHAQPSWYDADELEQLQALRSYLVSAPLSGPKEESA